jgi:hypothetical protein
MPDTEWYEIAVNKADDTPLVDAWYWREDICNGSQCELTLLLKGLPHHYKFRSYGAGGYSNHGNWSQDYDLNQMALPGSLAPLTTEGGPFEDAAESTATPSDSGPSLSDGGPYAQPCPAAQYCDLPPGEEIKE